MTCKTCGGKLRFTNGIAVCETCNNSYKIDHVFENVDVHICYIETDAFGRRTKDSIVAQELYQKLEAKKIHTFYERVSAGDLIGDDLEQVRYSSLHSAKILLVVGTSVENFNALSEKYSAFFSEKLVIPFCVDVKPADIPNSLSKIQVLDYSTIGWENDLANGLLRALGREQEIDLHEVSKQAKSKRRILTSVIIAICAIALIGFAVLHFSKLKGLDPFVQQSDTQIYTNAQDLLNNSQYLDALEEYLKIETYKNSEQQIKTILNHYEGYYQTDDRLFAIDLDFPGTDTVSLKLLFNTKNKTVEATIQEAVWTKSANSYSFTDNYANSGTVSIALQNDGIKIVTKMEKDNGGSSFGNQTVNFTFSQKVDKPKATKITGELLLSWLETPTTEEDLTSLGLELLPGPDEDNPSSDLTVGGGGPINAELYRLADDTDVRILFAPRVSIEKGYLVDVNYSIDGFSGPNVICAVLAPAEYLIPEQVGTQNRVFVENNILFASGTDEISVDTGYSDVEHHDVRVAFINKDCPSYSPNGTIQADTLVGAMSKKIVGDIFFTRTAVDHLEGEYMDGRFEGEQDGCYVFIQNCLGDYAACKVNKETYKIEEKIPAFNILIQDEDIVLYSLPSYESDVVVTLSSEQWSRYYFPYIETAEDESGNLWGKLVDRQGWICLSDISTDN